MIFLLLFITLFNLCLILLLKGKLDDLEDKVNKITPIIKGDK